MSSTFHPYVERVLVAAGWHPLRRIDRQVQAWRMYLEAARRFQLHAAAETVLLEFGGLQIGTSGPGIDCARSTLLLNPALAEGEEDRFLDYFDELRGRLAFPLGEVDNGHAFLAIDVTGRTYIIGDEVYARWPSFLAAIDCLLRGLRPHE